MRKFSLKMAALAVILISAIPARASDTYSFGFTSSQKKLEGEQKTNGDEIISREQWAYNVTIENKCFRDLENLEIQYIIFMKPEIPGQKMLSGHVELKRKSGSTSIKFFKKYDKFPFTTESMELTGTQLSGGYYWGNGANQNAKDALKGIWVRVFADGKQVAEYANPATITSKEHWDEPKKSPKKGKLNSGS
ncbi:MAG: hypothetical protein WCH43_15310 [Verrucomicrobiota bacterium]